VDGEIEGEADGEIDGDTDGDIEGLTDGEAELAEGINAKPITPQGRDVMVPEPPSIVVADAMVADINPRQPSVPVAVSYIAVANSQFPPVSPVNAASPEASSVIATKLRANLSAPRV
jgi:hypothetical protein